MSKTAIAANYFEMYFSMKIADDIIAEKCWYIVIIQFGVIVVVSVEALIVF